MVKVVKMKLLFSLAFLIRFSFSQGVSGAGTDEVSVMEGNSVTLNTGVETKQQKIRWYFNDDHIAQINGDQSRICTDVQCKERFRDRLKLDPQTGSLTITDITHTDVGVYTLTINGSRNKIFTVAVHGVFGVGPDGMSVSVMEGDSVTLQTGVQINQQEKINWYYNVTRIALITGDLRKICTDDQCKERFRDRLKLDPQTGSLTITNITHTDVGVYTLTINGSRNKIFTLAVHDVPAAERDKMKRKSVKEGESVTFYTRVIKNPTDVMMWYFNDTLITEITGDQSKNYTDDGRFRDRLKLDHQSGSLTITNTTNTHSGEYKLQINSGSISIIKTFSSFIHSVTGPSSAAEAGISAEVIIIVAVAVAVVLLVAAVVAGVICYRRHQGNGNTDNRGENKVKEEVPLLEKNGNGTGPPAANGTGPPPGDTQLPAANLTGSPAANGTGPPPGDTQLPAANGTVLPPGDTQLPAANGAVHP